MKICKKCLKEFNPFPVIDGKKRILHNRKFCLECSPYGKHNTSKFPKESPKSKIESLSKEEFSSLVRSSKSRSDLFFKLRMRKSGASFKILNRRLKEGGINISHFLMGCQSGNNRKFSKEETYTRNSPHFHIRSRFFKDNIVEYKCKLCGLNNSWNGKELTLELDHINGDRYDNRIENLRWLCPNCHSQTETFCGKLKM